MHTITLISGDGIGQEVIPATRQVIEALNLPFILQEAQAGFGTFEQIGRALPPETIALCEKSDAILFGATQSPMHKVEGYVSPILSLRRHFDLFANIRPAVGHFHGKAIDLLIVRENTEGLYSRRESRSEDGNTAFTERVITRQASERVIRLAFEKASQRGRQLTLVHKANVLKETCGLFREVGLSIAKEFPNVTVNELLVDAAAMRLVQDPENFDVIVTTNLFGDILSDLTAGLVGGLGVAPSANVGNKAPAIFEPVHGSAPDIVGKGIVNPIASFLSMAMMLDYLGYQKRAQKLANICHQTSHQSSIHITTQSIIQQLQVEEHAVHDDI